MATQLSKDVRYLQAQTHIKNGGVQMCHTTCSELDAGTLTNYLGNIKKFLDQNPNEVVTLLLVNGDFASPTLFDASFSAAGLKNYTFVPSTSPNPLPYSAWPTLGAMIASGKRLVVFLGKHGEAASACLHKSNTS